MSKYNFTLLISYYEKFKGLPTKKFLTPPLIMINNFCYESHKTSHGKIITTL